MLIHPAQLCWEKWDRAAITAIQSCVLGFSLSDRCFRTGFLLKHHWSGSQQDFWRKCVSQRDLERKEGKPKLCMGQSYSLFVLLISHSAFFSCWMQLWSFGEGLKWMLKLMLVFFTTRGLSQIRVLNTIINLYLPCWEETERRRENFELRSDSPGPYTAFTLSRACVDDHDKMCLFRTVQH